MYINKKTMIKMANSQLPICRYLSVGEACPFGAKCEFSHDIFPDPKMAIISKQLDSVISGLVYLDDAISNVKESINSLKLKLDERDKDFHNITNSISSIELSLRKMGVPVLHNKLNWGPKMPDSSANKESIFHQALTLQERSQMARPEYNQNFGGFSSPSLVEPGPSVSTIEEDLINQFSQDLATEPHVDPPLNPPENEEPRGEDDLQEFIDSPSNQNLSEVTDENSTLPEEIENPTE